MQPFDVRILRRFVEFLEVVHDTADDLGERFAEDQEGGGCWLG